MSKINMQLSKTSKRYDAHEKLELVLKQIAGISTMRGLKQEVGVDAKSMSNWKKQFFAKAHTIFEPEKTDKQNEKDKIIERQEKEIQLLKKLLNHYKRIQNGQSSGSPNSS